jgi:hypothetical protein
LSAYFIHTYYRVSSAHYYLPYYLFRGVLQIEKSKFRNFGAIFLIFEIQKIAHIHLYLLKVPLFQYVSKIFPKKHSAEPLILVKHVYPQAAVGLSHELECGGKLLMPINDPLLETVALK